MASNNININDDDVSSAQSSRHNMAYRITRQVGIELVPDTTTTADGSNNNNNSNNKAQPLEFSAEGLQSLMLTNFTGRLIFRRAAETTDESVLFSDTTSVVSHTQTEEEAPVSTFLDEEQRQSPPAAVAATSGALGLAAGAFLSGNKTNNAAPPKAAVAPKAAAVMMAEPSTQDPTPATVEFASSSDNTATINNNNKANFSFGSIAMAQVRNKVVKGADGGGDESNTATTSIPTKRKPVNPADLLRKVLNATALKRSIPESVRKARTQNRVTQYPTPLHQLCEQSEVTLEELFECLNRHLEAIRVKDIKGRYPLHIIGDNEDLITSDDGREVATVFSGHLINEFPRALLEPDLEGYIPFSNILADWVEWANDQETMKKAAQSEELNEKSGSPQARVREPFYSTKGDYGKWKQTLHSITHSSAAQRLRIRKGTKVYFPRVEAWEEVEWCLSMLSSGLEILGRNQNVPMFQRLRAGKDAGQTKQDDAPLSGDDRKILVDALAEKLPTILFTILLVDDDGNDTRERLLDMVVCRRLLLCSKAAGKWVTSLLNNGGIPSKRAVDYFVLISETSIEDYMGGYGSPHSADWDAFHQERAQVFQKIEALKGTIATLVTLKVSDTERAASTSVIWHTMCHKLSRHFVLGLVLIDLLLHFTMMLTFRRIALISTNFVPLDVNAHGLIYAISIHYFLRKGCEVWVLMSISFKTFQGYFSNMWTLLDSLAILLTLVATIYSDVQPNNYATGLNTLVVGLLWIKVLGFLKVINRSMSTFILALTQILYDIRLFMIVLLVCVLMFGDMFYTAVSTKNNGEFCIKEDPEGGALDDFCSSRPKSYLRTYSILLGDFELDDMTATPGTTVLFLIFTMFGVVILLNVLIAVISDSYERATMNSALLFGRARVLYVAQNEALEEFLRPQSQAEEEENGNVDHRYHYNLARKTTRWVVLLTILGTAIYSELFLFAVMVIMARAKEWWTFSICIVVAFFLFCALWVVITFILDGILRRLLPDRAERVYDFLNAVNNCLVGSISNGLFGLRKEKSISMSSDDSEEDSEWSGRMKYLEAFIERVVAESKSDLKAEMMEMRAEMNDHFDDR